MATAQKKWTIYIMHGGTGGHIPKGCVSASSKAVARRRAAREFNVAAAKILLTPGCLRKHDH